MDAARIRQGFIHFFQEKEHHFVRSAPVVPYDDPTLLFTNAGMNQFKPIFLGEQVPAHQRVVNSQKCIRVSGKHNDLEEVGLDTFHHTFFEMLGNWSFGDYYKAEAIRWAWELFTEVWGLDKNRLWATVYDEDDEAYELWPKVTDIPPERVLRFGAKENYWEMGDQGPCGPCSEIHYYMGEDVHRQSPKAINRSHGYWELWNLVFIQNNRTRTGDLEELPTKHVDTGAGLERIVTVLQNKKSNYETDLFLPIIEKVAGISGKAYTQQPVPFQVLADHVRMLTFAIADGAMPSNEGRGYVLRRILRRAARFGRMLDQHEPFIYQLVDTVGKILGSTYPEIVEKKRHIKTVLQTEEKAFNEALDRGLNHFEKLLRSLSGKVIPGKEAFRLYDTYGFPLDLTQLMARERGLQVDLEGFRQAMEQQRARAKAAEKFDLKSETVNWQEVTQGPDSKFLGYETLQSQSHIRRFAEHKRRWLVVLDQTPFYGEAGGQVGDTGSIKGPGINLKVVDCKKAGTTIIHTCEGELEPTRAEETVTCLVTSDRRRAIRLNHTATHLLHAALKRVLGEHVHQAGSLVHPDYLRFDFTHPERMTLDEIQAVEKLVNEEIIKNQKLETAVKAFDEARREGAEALFGEKYGDLVRVVQVGDFSKELCGGTHVNRTGDIGYFKILEETSLAAGIRRIMAVTGQKAVKNILAQSRTLTDLQSLLNSSPDKLVERVAHLLQQRKKLEKELKTRRTQETGFDLEKHLNKARTIDGVKVVIAEVVAEDLDVLKSLADRLRAKLTSGIGILGSRQGAKPQIVVVATKDLVDRGVHAGTLARSLGQVMDSGGGGRPHLGTAGGKNPDKLVAALETSAEIVANVLNTLKES
ncbi:MAG: alanine--tRNA ligase [Fidelibacterota bacterium]